MGDIWEYEPKTVYRQRQADRFRREASLYAFNQMARQELNRRGYDPDQFKFSTTMFDRQNDPVKQALGPGYEDDDDDGGLFGKIGNVASSFLGGAASVVKPVAKPLYQGAGQVGRSSGLFKVGGKLLDALTWEQEHVGGNLYRGAIATATTPMFALGLGKGEGSMSLKNAFITGWERSGRLPPLVKFAGSTVFDPLTYIGPGTIGKGLSLVGATPRIKAGAAIIGNTDLLAPIFGKAGLWARLAHPLPTMAGGADDPVAIQTILGRLSKVKQGVVAARTPSEVLNEARTNMSFSQAARHELSKTRFASWIQERMPNFFDTDVGLMWGERGRLVGMMDNASAAWSDYSESLLRQNFSTTKDGMIAVPKALNKEQRLALKQIDEIQNLTKDLRKAFGVRFTEYPVGRVKLKAPGEMMYIEDFLDANGIYAHRQIIKRPVHVLDQRSFDELEEAGGDVSLAFQTQMGQHVTPVRTRYGAKQPFQRPRTVLSKEEGVANGVEYMPFSQAQQAFYQQAGHKMGDEWLSAALSPLLKTPKELVPKAIADAREAITMKLRDVNRFKRAVNGFAIRTTKGLEFTKTAPEGFEEYVTRLNEAAKLTKAQGRTAAIKKIQTEIKEAINPLYDELRVAKARYARSMDVIKSGGGKLAIERTVTPSGKAVYHGTAAEFQGTPTKGSGFLGEGVYVTENAETAAGFTGRATGPYPGGRIYPMLLADEAVVFDYSAPLTPDLIARIKAAMPVEAQGEFARAMDAVLANKKSPLGRDVHGPILRSLLKKLGEGSNEVSAVLKSAGFDAVRESSEGVQYAVLNNKVLRSAFEQTTEVVGHRSYAQEFMGKFAPEAEGRQLRDLTQLKGQGVFDNSINKFNNLVRPLMATLDASFLGIQGLVGLGRNPKVYLQSLFTTMNHPEAYEGLVQASKTSGLLDDFIKAGGYWASRNDLGEFVFSGPAKYLPGARLSNTWFTRFGNVMRLKLYENAVNNGNYANKLGVLDDATKRGLAEIANKATGYVSTKPTSVETALTFAPRFFRSQLGLLSNAVTKGGPQGAEARRMVTQTLLLGAAFTFAMNKALGNKMDVDPQSPNFMRIRALGHDVSVFGPWDTLFKAVIRLVNTEDVNLADPSTYANVSLKTPEGKIAPVEAAKYFVRSKSSPALGRMIDLFTGESFTGANTDVVGARSVEDMLTALLNTSKQMAPIGLQQALESGIPTTPEQAAGSILQLGGTKATPLTAYENLQNRRDRYAQESFQKPWKDLEPYQRVQLEQEHKDQLTHPLARTDAGKAYASRSEIGQRYKLMQEELDKRVTDPQEWLDAYHDLNARKAGEYLQWEQNNPELAQAIQSNSDDPNYKALGEYYDVFDKARTPWGSLDFTVLDTEQAKMEASWTPAQRAFVDRNVGLHNTAKVREYRKAVETLKPYFDVVDQVWVKLKKLPKFAQYASLDSYLTEQEQRMANSGVPDAITQQRLSELPVVKEVNRAVATLRVKLRRLHPEIDAALVKWYGATPINQQSTASSDAAKRFMPKIRIPAFDTSAIGN